MKYLKNFNTEAEYLEYIASADNLPHISYIKDINKVRYNGEVAKDEPVKPKWTGHADAEGLRAIGWTEEDIAYYQENGVNWNAEDDQYHLVSEDNKALYGVLTADNIQTYKDRIVYLPKIDTSAKTSMSSMFKECRVMVAIPMLDTSSVTNMYKAFEGCYSLVSIPHLDTSKVTNMNGTFHTCCNLASIPPLDTSKVADMYMMFYFCYNLASIPPLDTREVMNMDHMFNSCYPLVSIPPLDTSKVTSMATMFRNCRSLASIPPLDTSKVADMNLMFGSDYSVTFANLANLKVSLSLSDSALFSKESLLYIINNEAAESAITITLHSYAYTRLAEDADIVAALANHPNVSLASA